MCVGAAGTNIPPLIVVRRRKHGMGGYGGSTDGINFGLHPSGSMQVDMFAK
jgi:hypothetical protein